MIFALIICLYLLPVVVGTAWGLLVRRAERGAGVRGGRAAT